MPVPQTTCRRGNLGIPCFGPDPTTLTCPYCRVKVTTKILPRFEPLTKCQACCYPFTYFWCCLCCCSKDDIKHVCPNCNRMLGIYEFVCWRW